MVDNRTDVNLMGKNINGRRKFSVSGMVEIHTQF
jgi:hypothetical protein